MHILEYGGVERAFATPSTLFRDAPSLLPLFSSNLMTRTTEDETEKEVHEMLGEVETRPKKTINRQPMAVYGKQPAIIANEASAVIVAPATVTETKPVILNVGTLKTENIIIGEAVSVDNGSVS